jgi:glutathione synthase/RimK-type ligase-like ATP-grasp enzyme
MPDISDDDRLVADLLGERGIEVSAAVWDAPQIDWSSFDGVVIRSTWDYHLKPQRYADWLRELVRMNCRVWNPPPAVLENMDKRYLLGLAEQGIEVVPTLFQAACRNLVLAEVLDRYQWNEVVIKPAVSASAWGAWRTSRTCAQRDQAEFARQIRDRDLLIQPYMHEITSHGEWSLVFFAGRYSHAVLKKPADGDFRVQRHLGGSTIPTEPDRHVIERAMSVLATVEHPLLYARVDGIERQGRFVLMELEINEPFLFLGYSEKAAIRFADAIATALNDEVFNSGENSA